MPVGNRWPLCALLVSACSVLAAAAGVVTPAQQDVLQADERCAEALVKGDVAALDGLIAPDVTYVGADGLIEDKRSILYRLRSGAASYRSIIATERRARVLGETAIVTGVVAMRGVSRAQEFDVTARYTAVYARRDGRWQLTAYQATPLPASGRVIGGESA